MKRKNTLNIKGLIINTVLGFVLSAGALYGFSSFVSGGEIETTQKEEAHFDFEDTEYEYAEAQPVFTGVLTKEELENPPETNGEENDFEQVHVSDEEIEKLKDFSFIRQNYYIIDSRTNLIESDINAQEFLSRDFSIDESTDGPKVLIFHTHSSEMFADSDPSKGVSEGIWGAGERLKEILEQKYGIEVLHDTGRYDVVDGKTQITGAYERMEPAIRDILAKNPSIEVVIDMHRDGVNEDVHLVTEQNGKQCAKIMFFNGLCRLNNNGTLENISYLPNPYLNDNLAFSFKMQYTANTLYPDFTRKIYLNAYRYSLHMMPKSLLIEVGAQTNTKEEVYNSMEILGEILAQVIKGE
jgi:stage II sporulation protein P